jgi:hypothetical protein
MNERGYCGGGTGSAIQGINEQFLELIQLLDNAGYQVKSIKQEEPQPLKLVYVLANKGKRIGDVVLRISPKKKPKSEGEE